MSTLKSLLRIIELKGIQASGKTTWAKEQLQRFDNVARVNRDDLRKMLFNGNYKLSKEHVVKAVELAAGKAILDNSYNLIVDDTNLTGDATWQKLAEDSGVKYTTRKFDVSTEDAIKRDAEREEPVGEVAIRATEKRRRQ